MNKSLVESLIKDELKRTGGNASKVARLLGIDYHLLKSQVAAMSPQGVFKPAMGPEPENIRTLGRTGFQHHVIAAKRQGSFWPDKYKRVIEDARDKFDAGTHEMFQTSDKGWVVQYLIPRRKRTERRYFFSSMEPVFDE